MDSPVSRTVFGQVTATPLSSVTVTLVNLTLPVLVTTYVQITSLPASSSGPSVPLVVLTMPIRGSGT